MKLKGSNGVRFTQQLFYEFGNKDAPYTLRHEDHTASNGKTYKSFSKIYLSCTDEYEAAQELLGSWSHWKKLCGLDWFMKGKVYNQDTGARYEGLEQWREEMRLRDESTNKRILQQMAQEGNVAAARYLNETARKQTGTKGRPQKNPTGKTNSSVLDIVSKLEKRG